MLLSYTWSTFWKICICHQYIERSLHILYLDNVVSILHKYIILRSLFWSCKKSSPGLLGRYPLHYPLVVEDGALPVSPGEITSDFDSKQVSAHRLQTSDAPANIYLQSPPDMMLKKHCKCFFTKTCDIPTITNILKHHLLIWYDAEKALQMLFLQIQLISRENANIFKHHLLIWYDAEKALQILMISRQLQTSWSITSCCCCCTTGLNFLSTGCSGATGRNCLVVGKGRVMMAIMLMVIRPSGTKRNAQVMRFEKWWRCRWWWWGGVPS